MTEVTAIFDVGKTNKKLFLFDNRCNVVYEYSETLPEIKDDDGFPCEDVQLLKEWMLSLWSRIISNKDYEISSVNFTAYGASFVHLNGNGQPVTPLYNYLKPFSNELAEKLYEQYGGRWNFSSITSSPPMGMLNSGLQLLWLKYRKPDSFLKINWSLHLPQYLSFLFSGKKVSEFTSIGCHTALWDFARSNYHPWVKNEGMDKLLAPLISNPVVGELELNNRNVSIGTGLHDSSSALIPYFKKGNEPFLLISTGTWCITLNPFNRQVLTKEELSLDCLCYLTPGGKPVKASRIFLGREHEYQSERIERHFEKSKGYCNTINFDPQKLNSLLSENSINKRLIPAQLEGTGPFPGKTLNEWNLSQFSSCEHAYLQLLLDLTSMLKYSVQLVDSSDTKTIFVEGGFGNNEVFMNLFASHLPNKQVKSSHLKQATALGAALQVNETCKLEDWKFKDYKASDVSKQLEDYYNRYWKNQGI